VLIYPCCSKQKDKIVDDEEKGCDDAFHGGCKKKFSCCKLPPDAGPCSHEYECCGRPPNSEGCETVWKCCEELFGAEGCKERYKCCHMPESARGCEDKWLCCGQAPEERGCQTVCDRCGVRWGHKPGCTWPQVDDDENDDAKRYHDENDENRRDDYDESANPVVQRQMTDDERLETKRMIDAEASPAPILGAIPETAGPALDLDASPDEENGATVILDASYALESVHEEEADELPVGSKPTEALL